MSHPPADQPPRRAIRSYVVRAGRMGTGQQRALAELAPRFVLPYRAERSDFAAAFAQSAPLVIEIGAGEGVLTEFLAERATKVIAIELVPGRDAARSRTGHAASGRRRGSKPRAASSTRTPRVSATSASFWLGTRRPA